MQTTIITTAEIPTSTDDVRVSPDGLITVSYQLHSDREGKISLSGTLKVKDCPSQYIITDIVAMSKGGTSWTAQLKEIDVSEVVITTSHIELELQDGRITDLRYDQQLCTQ